METASRRRKRKLELLCSLHGGHVAVAKKANVNPASLEQVLKGVLLPAKRDGTRSPRNLGDTAARAIEEAYELGLGWFDSPDGRQHFAFSELNGFEGQLVTLFRALTVDEQHGLLASLNKHIEAKRTGTSTSSPFNVPGNRRQVDKPVEVERRESSGGVRGMSLLGELDELSDTTGMDQRRSGRG